jgi:hypothetical protein
VEELESEDFVFLQVLQRVLPERQPVYRTTEYDLYLVGYFEVAPCQQWLFICGTFQKFTKHEQIIFAVIVTAHPSPHCFTITCFERLEKRPNQRLEVMSCMAQKTKHGIIFIRKFSRFRRETS